MTMQAQQVPAPEQGQKPSGASQEQPAAIAPSPAQQQAPAQQAPPAALSEEQVKALRSLNIYQQDIAAAQKPLQQKIAALEKQVKAASLDPEVLRGITAQDALFDRASAWAKRMGVPEEKIARAKASPDPLGTLDLLTDAYTEGRSGNDASDAKAAASILQEQADARNPALAKLPGTMGGGATQQKTDVELADGPWDPKAVAARLRSLGVRPL